MMREDLIGRYKELTDTGTQHLRRGEFQEASGNFREARTLAEKLRDQQLLYRAICNLSTASLNLGEVTEAEKGLRQILLKSDDPNTIFVASSNLASSLRRQGKLQKALLYAKRAKQACEEIDNYAWKATCHNLIANIYMNLSYLDDAMTEYRFALRLSQKGGLGTAYPIDYIKENLGYCLLMKQRYRQGIAMILEAQQIATHNNNFRCLAECFQDLCFAYMQMKELNQAAEHGVRALAVAEEKKYADISKNCFYLLGEIHLLMGNEQASDHYFGRLQELYPHLPALKDFLRTFDVSNIINLKTPC